MSGAADDVFRPSRWGAAEPRFGRFAEGYDVSRPTYPDEAVDWMVDGCGPAVLELGAGTGKLTASLVARGFSVVATEPDLEMLKILHRRVPGAIALQALAESPPLPDRSVDGVLAAQSWHWFDPEKAWSSAQRVLNPSGRLAMVWNAPARRAMWQQEIADVHPAISPVTEEWWPPRVPRDVMEQEVFYWTEFRTARNVLDEHMTHLAVRRLEPSARADYLRRIEEIVDTESTRRGDGLVAYERLTWCARQVDRSGFHHGWLAGRVCDSNG